MTERGRRLVAMNAVWFGAMRRLVMLVFVTTACGGRAAGPPPSNSAPTVATAAPTYALFARFRDASGLPVGSRVVIAGLPLGEVTSLEIDGHAALVRFTVKAHVQVWSNAIVSKKPSSELGDYYLELDPGEELRVGPDGARQASTRLGPACPTYHAASRGDAESCQQIRTVVEATIPDELIRRIEERLPNRAP